MAKMIWVHDSAVAFHYNDNLEKGVIEIGYVDRGAAAESLIMAMENDKALMSIILAAAANYCVADGRAKKKLMDVLNGKAL